eukprot:s2939_g2.t1
MPGPPADVFAMVFWCVVGAHALSDGACGDCMEHEQNVLMQLPNLQPDLDSPQDHHPPFRRFRRLRRRFRGFGRYGGKTTTPAPTKTTTRAPGGTTGASPTTSRATSTTTKESTTTEATTASTTSTASTTTTSTTSSTASTTVPTGPTSTTTTRVVCTGDTNVRLSLDGLNPAQNEFTIESLETSQECQCVGSPVSGSIPGWLEVLVRGVGDPKNVSFISITSPNSTEVRVTPISAAATGSLFAGTVAFNGFQGVGNWSIRLLNAGGSLSSETGTSVLLEFEFIACSQVSPTPDCVGNVFGGRDYVARNPSLIGTTLSTSPSLLQFDVEVSDSCCVPGSQFSSSTNIELITQWTTVATGTVSAEGLSPSGIPFNLTGILIGSVGFARLRPGFVGSQAAGLWNLSTSTDGASLQISGATFDPFLQLRVEPCS